MVRFRVAAVVALLVCASSAVALQDELLPGTTLALRQGKRKGERLVIVSKSSVPAPLPGGADDPRLTGARVDIGNPTTQEWARLEAPATGWSVNELGTLFRFENPSPKDRLDEPVRVVIRHGKGLKVVSHAIGLTLDEPAQRSLAVVVTSGDRRYCLFFGGKVRHDEPGRFVARAAPVPASCPTPSATPTPTTSTTSSTRPRPGRSTTTSTTSTTATSAPSGLPGSSTTSTTTGASTSSSTTTPGPTSSSTPPPPTTSTSSTQPPPPTSTTTLAPVDPCDGLDIPSGQRPRPGECRVWFPGRPPGQQPPAGDCDDLEGNVPEGACLVRG
jgi:hypothetical protein